MPGRWIGALAFTSVLALVARPIWCQDWGWICTITASDAEEDDSFGRAVAISGDMALVGAPSDKCAGGYGCGSAYIFYRDQGGADNWGEVAKLNATDTADRDHFGEALGIDGDTAVVGAYGDDCMAGQMCGAAYIFYRDQGGADSWGEVAKLTAPDADGTDGFGYAVAISGDVVVSGARWNGPYGAAYVFYRNQGGPDNWGEVAKLVPSNPTAWNAFGWSVGISGDVLVVGAISDEDGGEDAGAAYVFYRNQGGTDAWGEVIKLPHSVPDAWFGYSVAVFGELAVVGAPGDYLSGLEGEAYVYYKNAGGSDLWGAVATLSASDSQPNNKLGWSVGADTENIIVAAENASSVYLFNRDQGGPDSWGEVAKKRRPARTEFGWSAAISQDTAIVGAREDFPENGGAAHIFQEDAPVPVELMSFAIE